MKYGLSLISNIQSLKENVKTSDKIIIWMLIKAWQQRKVWLFGQDLVLLCQIGELIHNSVV